MCLRLQQKFDLISHQRPVLRIETITVIADGTK